MESELADIRGIARKYLGSGAEISETVKTTNNQVFIVKAGNKEYVLKLYKSKEWPEDGKNLYVNSLLKQNNIPYAKICGYSREDEISAKVRSLTF